jgi:hypothetical protein
MESSFAEDIELEEQPPESSSGAPNVLSLLPKVVAAGPLLSNSISPDNDANSPGSDRPGKAIGGLSAFVEASGAIAPLPIRARESALPPFESRPPAAQEEELPDTAQIEGRASRGKAFAWGVFGGVSILVLAGAGFLVMQEADSGFISIALPAELKAKNVSVTFSGEPVPVTEQGPLVHKVSSGPGTLSIQADGFQPFSELVEIRGMHEVTDVPVKLSPVVQNAQLAIVAYPEDAEIRINGRIVTSSDGTAFYLGEIPVGSERAIEVSRKGYRTFESRIKASKAGEQVKVHAKLEPSDYWVKVQSNPSGATVSANGSRLGRTPVELHLPGNAGELTLTKRCYQPLQLPLTAKPDAGEPVVLNVSLKRSLNCR